MKDKTYTYKSSSDILNAVNYFCNYYGLITKYIKNKKIFSSLDRGAFARPQFALKADIYSYLTTKRRSNSFAYGPEIGDEEIRNKIAIIENKKFNTNYTKDNIAIVAGAWSGVELVLEELSGLKNGIAQSFKLAVIGPTHYQLFHRAINILGIEVFAFDFNNPNHRSTPTNFEVIDELLKEKPNAIFISNPNNPNGQYFPHDLLKKLIMVAKKEKIYIIIDELQNFLDNTIAGLNYGKWIESSFVIRIDSFSKKKGLAEYRNGWVIADKNVLGDRTRGVIGRLSGLMGNAPRAANTVISKILDYELVKINSGVDYFDYLDKKLLKLESYILQELYKIPEIKILQREGCFNMTIQVIGFESDIQFSELLMEEGVLIIPCSGYGYDPKDVVMRITFAERLSKIKLGIKALKKVIETNRTKYE